MDINLKKEPENLYEALKDALFLHIMAPTKEQSDEALHLADMFSENLTEDSLKSKPLDKKFFYFCSTFFSWGDF